MAVSIHTIEFHGPSGMMYIFLMVASIFYILGFGSNGWSQNNGNHIGLWADCVCKDPPSDSYFVATQVFIAIGLAALLLAVILATLYMCVGQISRNLIIVSIIITCFVAVLAMFIGILIFGVESPGNPDWSFAMAVIGMIFTLAAGCASIVQMQRSDVPCLCQCRK